MKMKLELNGNVEFTPETEEDFISIKGTVCQDYEIFEWQKPKYKASRKIIRSSGTYNDLRYKIDKLEKAKASLIKEVQKKHQLLKEVKND